MGRLIKLNVPHECDDIVKRLKGLMVNVRAADLTHMEETRKKLRDTRQPILTEEIDTASWAVRVPFLLGKSIYTQMLQHVSLSPEELKDPDAAVAKFLSYYDSLRSRDISRPTLDEAEKRRRMQVEADRAAKSAGYTVVSRAFVQYVIVKYACPNAPPLPQEVPGAGHVDEVLIAESKWKPETEEKAIRESIALRMKSIY